MSLKVLCLWNVRELPGAKVQRSWVVDELSRDELTDALRLHEALATKETPTQMLADRIGPPIQHPLDPRKEYLEEERSWMSRFAGHSAEAAPIQFPQRSSRLRKAAEDRAKYEVDRKKDEPPSGKPR